MATRLAASFGPRLEGVEAIAPELVQGCSHLREPRQIDAVEPALRVDPNVH
jgi:hypothetical protein